MTGYDEPRAAPAAAMDQSGAWPARSPWIRRAVDAVPRQAFAPDRLWRWGGHTYLPVDRAADPGQWAAVVYSSPHAAAVTQVTDGVPSSNLSAQGTAIVVIGGVAFFVTCSAATSKPTSALMCMSPPGGSQYYCAPLPRPSGSRKGRLRRSAGQWPLISVSDGDVHHTLS